LVNQVLAESGNSAWIASSNGLFRSKDGVIRHLGIENGLPCSLIFSVIKDDYGSMWMYSNCGVLKVPMADLEKWWDSPESRVAVKAYDSAEGARPGSATGSPRVTKTADGRIWFSNGLAVQTIDPKNLYRNDVAPLVRIEAVVADRKTYSPQDNLRLPALTRDLEIDYTALSLSVPQKVRFRYRLDGHDVNWQEPAGRRQAFYSDLRPGTYTFRVIASNNDDVWNEVGSTLVFTIPPAWYQTIWFRLACLATVLLILFIAYQLRVGQIARVLGERFDDRLAERTRMARELHDTFLQTIQGCTLVADDALETATDLKKMRRAMERLSKWLNQATQEGRAALNSLRTSTTEKNDLADAFRRATHEGLIPSSMTVDFAVIGESKELHPIVRDEVYRLGYEAIRNSILHSHASKLKVELKYGSDLVVRVQDNGVGIDATVLSEGKEGHFGLQGMRERAARVGGKLTIASSPATGTDITVMISGNIVFKKSALDRIDPLKS
jgi:signal transduction histidine kinase